MVNVGEIPGTIEEEIDKDLEAITGETTKPDLTTFDFESLKTDPTATVRYKGETWNIYDLIRFNPHDFDRETEAGLKAMQLWINELYASTEHYRNNEEGRGLRKQEWDKAGDDSDELTTRQKDLISTFVETIEEIAALSNLGWGEDEINEFALDAWLAGWTEDQIKDLISEDLDLEFGIDARPGSDIAANVANINERLRQHLMDPSQMDEGWVEDASRRIYRGETTLDILATELAEQSATLYPNFAERIRAGVAPTTILNSYNPIFRNVFGYTPSWDGSEREMGMTLGNDPAVLSGANFAHYLRTTDLYDRSEAGLNKGYDIMQTMGKALGLVP
jgi:hypothetical protein